jgi:hypothetical protein
MEIHFLFHFSFSLFGPVKLSVQLLEVWWTSLRFFPSLNKSPSFSLGPARPNSCFRLAPPQAQPQARRTGPSGIVVCLVPDPDSPESMGIPPAPRCLSASELGTARSPVIRAHNPPPRCVLDCAPHRPLQNATAAIGARLRSVAVGDLSRSPLSRASRRHQRLRDITLHPLSLSPSPALEDQAGRHECRRR